MPKFIPGLKLAEGFYRDVVEPILAKAYPDLSYAAALIGDGSEVLGLDTEMSIDHHWGPRIQLFLPESCDDAFRHALHEVLASRLPHKYRGFPTNFHAPNEREAHIKKMKLTTTGAVKHLVEVTTLKAFSEQQMGFDATRPLTEEEWLAVPQQQLLSMTAGRVFRDDIGLEDLRKRLEWYPTDIWLFLLACTWWRIRCDERIVGRVGIVSDELGASLVAARIVRDLMRLAFFMERRYAPYAKWLGTAFTTLNCASKLGPQLTDVVRATSWLERDMALAGAYETVAEMHNTLGLTKPMPAKSRPFRGRPFHIIFSDQFALALLHEIKSERLHQLFKEGLSGNIDLITDNEDVSISTYKQGRILRIFAPD